MKLSRTNGRGLDHFSTWPRARDLGSGNRILATDEIEISTSRRPALMRVRRCCREHSSSKILVTLAERPYPFPSRTRKSSSPAPKILRGQPFGKIGRRQDLVLSGGFWLARLAAMTTVHPDANDAS